ncbi:hypothetical protein, partial [Xylanibacter ruminicola]|uniref:hypothetical protein n=1 Tax=Xylanibacter ruminicola TaxID=839 RepID=UPI001E63E94C
FFDAKVGKTCQTSERIWSVFVAGDKCERICSVFKSLGAEYQAFVFWEVNGHAPFSGRSRLLSPNWLYR